MRVRKIVTGLFVFGIVMAVCINLFVFQNVRGVYLNIGEQSYRDLKEIQTRYNNAYRVNALGSLINIGKLSSKDASGLRNIESVAKREPSTEHEMARRKLEGVSTEFWLFVRSELNKLKQNAQKIDVGKTVDGIVNNSIGYQSMLKKYFHELENEVDGFGAWRNRESQKLGDLVQRRLNYLQNPKDCESAKKLACEVTVRCGYSCMVHHVAECLIKAYATQRTLVLTLFKWRYSSGGMESAFEPLSRTCNSSTVHVAEQNSTDMEQAAALEMTHDLSEHSISNVLPMAVPDDLADRLMRFHGDPSAWWIGQIVTYLTRPNSVMDVYLQSRRKELGFENPIVGVHVRRTDKLISEAKFHSIEEYMTHVEEWFDAYAQRNPDVQRRVYLASDDPKVFIDARKRYPHYTFISNNFASNSTRLGRQFNETSLQRIILDTHLLSLCDYLVCTFSSGVCRLAYELMQPRHGDASQWFKSLDDIYYFGHLNNHQWKVVQQHVAKNGDEISLNVGDFVDIAGNHWDGYSKGKDVRTGRSGLFPSYKAVNKIDRLKMPTYPEVPDL